jgi:hypothetical protein
MVYQFVSLVFETFVEPVCAELEDISWSVAVNGAV